MMFPNVQTAIVGFNAIWAVAYLIAFSIYYSKYSACFHKLSSVDSLEKTGLYEKELIDATRINTWKRIKKLRRISFFPPFGIVALHLMVFYFYWTPEIFNLYYLTAFYLLVGALVLVLLANLTKGSKVLGGKKGPFGPF